MGTSGGHPMVVAELPSCRESDVNTSDYRFDFPKELAQNENEAWYTSYNVVCYVNPRRNWGIMVFYTTMVHHRDTDKGGKRGQFSRALGVNSHRIGS